MNAKVLQDFVMDHPEGVRIRMIDGTQNDILHRDYIWFTPAYGKASERAGRYATSFWIHDKAEDRARLVNALMVADVLPLSSAGNGSEGKPRKANGTGNES